MSNKESGEVLMTIVTICLFVGMALGVTTILSSTIRNQAEDISEAIQSTAPTSPTSPTPSSDTPSNTGW
jgi:hypothetical protein